MSDASELGADLDLRLVRYFTVVAEHLNFGRAAAALHLAQPSLSRQIQRLEDQLGVRLFDRTPQGSHLTEAGRAFLPRARELMQTARQAMLAARAAEPPLEITIGYVGDLVVTPAVRELRRHHPDAKIRTRHLTWQDTHALPEHRVDALVTRLPNQFVTDHLTVTVLYDEPRVLVMPLSHRLAGKESVTVDDLSDEELVACTMTPSIWSGPRTGVEDSYEDKLELVAGGYSVAILPAGDRRSTLRADLVTIPIEGIEPVQVVVATRTSDRNPLLAAFRQFARSHLTGTTGR